MFVASNFYQLVISKLLKFTGMRLGPMDVPRLILRYRVQSQGSEFSSMLDLTRNFTGQHEFAAEAWR